MDKAKVKYSTADELYAEWYECIECGCSDILDTFNYCPRCGTQIDWETEE